MTDKKRLHEKLIRKLTLRAQENSSKNVTEKTFNITY